MSGRSKKVSTAKAVQWYAPIIEALKELGGSATTEEVRARIIENGYITKDEASKPRPNNNSVKIFYNELGWARDHLVKSGYIDKNSKRGVWTLTDKGKNVNMTPELATSISRAVRKGISNDSDNDVVDVEKEGVKSPVYDENDFLKEVYMDERQYKTLTKLIRTKKNVILQGSPGVGKTYAAKRLAYSMMGCKDKERIMMVQFHQSYSYEDFIMGFRPTETGFTLKTAVFYDFCKIAEKDSDHDYFFIIDEINRGNLSKIFGELLMLIESDKRGLELKLLYTDEKFAVPKNVYIIGTMNTADRSLAMMDYALRRRFAFFEMTPCFDNDGFKKYISGLDSAKFKSLIDCVKSLNEVIKKDTSLGEGFCIGHSYFCNLEDTSDQKLADIVDYELIPLLKEYWFDEPSKITDWTSKLKESVR